MPEAGKSPHLFININTPEESTSFEVNKAVRSWVTKAQHDRRREHDRKQEQASPKLQQGEEHHNALSERRGSSSSTPHTSRRNSAISKDAVSPTEWATEWAFMPFDPQTKQTKETRRQIQSHVTRRQHQRRRELELSEAKPAADQSTSSQTAASVPVTPGLSTASTPGLDWKQSFSAEDLSTSAGFPWSRSTSPQKADHTSPLLTPALADHTNKLNGYASQLGTEGSTIWARYLWQEREHGRLFHSQYQHYRGYGPKYLHRLILSNEAMLATTVLFTACHLRHSCGETIMSPAILRLRSSTYNIVQDAINSEADQSSDATIIAVVKLALFEAVFGRRNAYRIHMQGIVQMVRLREGLQNLGLDGYIAHLLIWFDSRLSVMTRTSRYLDHEIGASGFSKLDVVNEEAFALGVRMDRPLDGESE